MAKFFKISELSRESGVNLETIRYYEKIGLITPAERLPNGYRRFGEPQLHALHFIKTCRTIGFGLDEIKQLLALQANPQNGCRIADELAQQHLHLVEHQIAQLRHIKALLEPLVGCKGQDVDHCQIIQGIKKLDE